LNRPVTVDLKQPEAATGREANRHSQMEPACARSQVRDKIDVCSWPAWLNPIDTLR
jgi:hypothetical protein